MQITEKMKTLVEPLCREMELRLVEVQVQGSQRNLEINVFADSENGITLRQCTKLARMIQDELDMDDAYRMKYRLNVSSPGLDRPLSEDWEFQKNLGRMLTVRYTEEEAVKEITGKLTGWNADTIEIEMNGENATILRAGITRAKIKLQW